MYPHPLPEKKKKEKSTQTKAHTLRRQKKSFPVSSCFSCRVFSPLFLFTNITLFLWPLFGFSEKAASLHLGVFWCTVCHMIKKTNKQNKAVMTFSFASESCSFFFVFFSGGLRCNFASCEGFAALTAP